MHIIIYAKTDGEGHIAFPIHVLDDVTYYNTGGILSLIDYQLFQVRNPWQTVLFLWQIVFCNRLTYQIRSVVMKKCLCLCKWQKWRIPALVWDTCQGYQASGGRRTVCNWSGTLFFDPRKLCGPNNNVQSFMSWLHGYITVVHDFPKIQCMCRQWIPGPSFSGKSGLGMRLYLTTLQFSISNWRVGSSPAITNHHLDSWLFSRADVSCLVFLTWYLHLTSRPSILMVWWCLLLQWLW